MKTLFMILIVLFWVLWTLLLSSGIVFIIGLFGIDIPLWVGFVILILLNMIFVKK